MPGRECRAVIKAILQEWGIGKSKSRRFPRAQLLTNLDDVICSCDQLSNTKGHLAERSGPEFLLLGLVHGAPSFLLLGFPEGNSRQSGIPVSRRAIPLIEATTYAQDICSSFTAYAMKWTPSP